MFWRTCGGRPNLDALGPDRVAYKQLGCKVVAMRFRFLELPSLTTSTTDTTYCTLLIYWRRSSCNRCVESTT